MQKKTILLSLFLSVTLVVGAQQKGGGISPKMMSEIEKSQSKTPANKALFNAMAANSIDNLAANFASKGELDTYFSHETKSQSIHDQKKSGRCWMFTGMNVLRARFAQQHNDTLHVEFSQAHLFFYDQMEKANLMLQGVVDNAKKPLDDKLMQFFFRNPINDGGTFCGIADLADKYGLVPMGVQPETFSAENTSRMAALVSSKLREYGLELYRMVNGGKKPAAVEARKKEMLSQIYYMLSMTIGEPVKEFTYAFKDKNGKTIGEPKTYTPLSFYREVVGGSINGSFIMVMNDPRREYYKTYEVEYDRHMYDGHNWKYLNLPMEEIEQMAIAAIKDGRKLYSSYDVGKQLDNKRGYCALDNYDYATLFSTTFPMNKADRIATFDSGSTHAMTLTAVDLDANGNPKKWKVENSWGASWGQKGCLIMTADWFREYMFRMVVDKQYVPERLLELEKQKPTMVMPDDPLFQMDE